MSELPRPSKPVSASRTEQVHIVMPADVNGSYTLFGGILMQWIDVVAGVVSRRHSGMADPHRRRGPPGISGPGPHQ